MIAAGRVRAFADELNRDSEWWRVSSAEAVIVSQLVAGLHHYAAILEEHADRSTLPKRRRHNHGHEPHR